MPLQLDHTIVPAYDKVKSAEFIARMFGLKYEGPWGHFAPVKVNDILTLDFDDSDNPRSNHYAFLASDDEFDAILQRIKDESVAFGSGPRSRTDGEVNTCTRGAGSTSSARTGIVGGYYLHVCYGLAGVAVVTAKGCWRDGRWVYRPARPPLGCRVAGAYCLTVELIPPPRPWSLLDCSRYSVLR